MLMKAVGLKMSVWAPPPMTTPLRPHPSKNSSFPSED